MASTSQTLFFASLLFAGCSQSFDVGVVKKLGGNGSGETPPPTTPTDPAGPVTVVPPPGNGNDALPPTDDDPSVPVVRRTLQAIEPALAVRGISCLMCHAKIHSNIVTDFGYGESFFLEKSTYGNHENRAWQSAREILGSVVVPSVRVPASLAQEYVNNVSGPMTLKQILLSPQGKGGVIAQKVQAANGNPQARVVERATVKIRTPTEQAIRDILPAAYRSLDLNAASAQVIALGISSSVSGLSSASGNYTINDTGGINCVGDVAVIGTLVLKDLRLRTNDRGCRLYVSGSVFIDGPVEYDVAPEVQKHTLQIASARAILLGFSAETLGANPSANGPVRIANDEIFGFSRFRQSYDFHYRTSNAPLNPGAFLDSIVSDALGVSPYLVDAADPASGGVRAFPTPESEARPVSRREIEFDRILLNAPQVHSRYLGLFKGTIIADIAIFVVGNVNFAFDPVFRSVDVLPLLKAPIEVK